MIKPPPRYFKPASIGPFHSKMFMLMLALVIVVKRTGGWSRRNKIPLNYILGVEIFDVWGVDFMVPFHPLRGIDISWLRWIM